MDRSENPWPGSRCTFFDFRYVLATPKRTALKQEKNVMEETKR